MKKEPFRVLVVEDDSDFREAIVSMLGGMFLKEEINIMEAVNCEEALAHLRENLEFKLISLDIHFDKKLGSSRVNRSDGRVVLEEIAKHHPNCTVIVLSALYNMSANHFQEGEPSEIMNIRTSFQALLRELPGAIFIAKDPGMSSEELVKTLRRNCDFTSCVRRLIERASLRRIEFNGTDYVLTFNGVERLLKPIKGIKELVYILTHPDDHCDLEKLAYCDMSDKKYDQTITREDRDEVKSMLAVSADSTYSNIGSISTWVGEYRKKPFETLEACDLEDYVAEKRAWHQALSACLEERRQIENDRTPGTLDARILQLDDFSESAERRLKKLEACLKGKYGKDRPNVNSIKKRLEAVIKKISITHEALGKHLVDCVHPSHGGVIYQPMDQIEWELKGF